MTCITRRARMLIDLCVPRTCPPKGCCCRCCHLQGACRAYATACALTAACLCAPHRAAPAAGLAALLKALDQLEESEALFRCGITVIML